MTAKATDNPEHLHHRKHSIRSVSRKLAIGLLAAVTCLALTAYTVVRWSEHQILNTDHWVAFVSPLPKQPVVYTALGSFVTAQIFHSAPVQEEIAAALPPKAAFLASPLTDQLQKLTTQVAQRVISSDAFQTVWTAANRTAMNRVLTSARNQAPAPGSRINQKFSVNINDIKSQLSSKLGSVSSALPDAKPKSSANLALAADLKSRPRKVRQAVRTIDYLNAVLPYAVVAALLGTLALAHRRRRAVIKLAWAVIVLFILELIAVKVLRQQVLDQVRVPANLPAISYIYDSLLGSFRHMMIVGLALLLLVIAICLFVGPTKWARSLRARTHLDGLYKMRWLSYWHQVRRFAKKYLYYAWAVAVLCVLLYLAFIATIKGPVLVNCAFALAGLMALIYLIATPRSVEIAHAST